MKAIILAAGFGTRLRPLTNTIPKCLVLIKNKPLLEIWLEKLESIGIDNILINTHYLSNLVRNFIENCKFNKNCTIAFEKELLGTAGTLINNLKFIGNDDCILIHADNYCTEDLNKLIIAHKNRPKNCLMTMMTFRTNTPTSCGIVKVNSVNIVEEFYEKVQNPPGNLANCAVYILSNCLVELIKANYINAIDFSNEILPKLIGKIYTYETSATFIDIGTPESYLLANSI